MISWFATGTQSTCFLPFISIPPVLSDEISIISNNWSIIHRVREGSSVLPCVARPRQRSCSYLIPISFIQFLNITPVSNKGEPLSVLYLNRRVYGEYETNILLVMLDFFFRGLSWTREKKQQQREITPRTIICWLKRTRPRCSYNLIVTIDDVLWGKVRNVFFAIIPSIHPKIRLCANTL